jgi:hypothetical protein
VEELPEELLVQVLLALEHPSHLPRVALVCRLAPPTPRRRPPSRPTFDSCTLVMMMAVWHRRWHRVSSDPLVQRLWWGHHPIRLHRPLRHRCRTALSCGLSPDLDALFGDHVLGIHRHMRFTGTRELEPVTLRSSSPTSVYR